MITIYISKPSLSLCCILNLQHSRWAWRRSSSRCGRSCCRCRPQSGGSLPSPGQTAVRRSWSARSPPSCKHKAKMIKSETEERQNPSPSESQSLDTYAPHSTFREQMFSMPHSMMFWQQAVNSMRLPWKYSWSYTVICTAQRWGHERTQKLKQHCS